MLWTTRQKLFMRYPILLPSHLFVCVLLWDCAKCDNDLTLNFCCPPNSQYDLQNDNCAEVTETTTNNVALEENARQNDSKGLGREPLETDYVTLPGRLVLDFRKRNQSEYKFRRANSPDVPANACNKGKFTVVLNLREDTQEEITGTNNSQSNHTTGRPPIPQSPIWFTSKGQLRVENEYYSPPEFCIARFQNEMLTLRVCNATCSENTPCIRKCCDLNEVWDLKRKSGARQFCVSTSNTTWEPEFYKYPKVKVTPEERKAMYPHYKIVTPKVFCSTFKRPVVLSIEHRDHNLTYWKFRVNTKGDVFIRATRYTWNNNNPKGLYCLDGALNSEFWVGEDQLEYSGLREDEFMLTCSEKTKPVNRDQSALYACLMFISCFFLLLTMAVHIALYDKQPNRAWTLTLLSYTMSLFFFYLVFALMHISGFIIKRGEKIDYFCYSIGVGVNFFFVSTFCWMSAVNYDIFCTFKVLKPTAGRSKGLRKYLMYAGFSLTVPIVIVTIGLVIDNLYRYDYDSGIIVPEYGIRKCNLDSEYAQLVYTYGPAGVLLIFNIICFAITIYTMHKIQKSTKFATASSSKKRQQEQSLKLFAKLIFVMGVPWIFEIISWYVEKDKEAGNSWYWIVTDLINIFQAVAIFWIFVCKPDIIRQLEQKYPWFTRFLDSVFLDTESARKITERHPKLKRFVGPLTRKGTMDTGSSGAKTGGTAESAVSTSNAQVELGSMETQNTELLSQKSTQ
ncbi:unnamed protein product [Allacma fusca]|uniref:G-protein coupled receptors family 2 profile 2 domain-containing protein n=1 Tax=Allacma fusca TaxID=39272 RepID=A0A8J2NFS0_9HEXA|nr:unnamed protein product [Allacma fusca]